MLRFRTMTFIEPETSMWPCTVAPHSPTTVLFERMLKLPVIVPVRYTTAGAMLATAVPKGPAVATLTGVALPPPVVGPSRPMPGCDAQPMSSLAGGGSVLVQDDVLPPAPLVAPP